MDDEARGTGDAPTGLTDDPGAEVVELPLLLTGRQASALEAMARRRGLTAAQLLRRLVQRHLECEPATVTG